MSQQYPFSTEPLPYDYRALEPEIDAETCISTMTSTCKLMSIT